MAGLIELVELGYDVVRLSDVGVKLVLGGVVGPGEAPAPEFDALFELCVVALVLADFHPFKTFLASFVQLSTNDANSSSVS